jgi:hypothetical protein
VARRLAGTRRGGRVLEKLREDAGEYVTEASSTTRAEAENLVAALVRISRNALDAAHADANLHPSTTRRINIVHASQV